MKDLNKQKNWVESIFVVMIIFLNIVSFASNFIRAILNSIYGTGSLMEYLLLLFYILPALIIWGLIKRKTWAFITTGIWCLVSVCYLFSAVVFSALGGTIWLLLVQFISVAILSGVGFYLGVRRLKDNI